MTPSHDKTPSGDRKILFTAIAIAIPFALLLLTEGILRLAGFGDDYPLFVPLEQQPDYLQPNPDVIKRFFSDPDHAPNVSIDTGYFLAEKPENGLRIVVQGGSSAAGFPYGKNASPAGMLQQRLSRSHPGNAVEVILTAMSAVNSYTLLEFADEIIAIEPDAVVIYAGHNEFLGVLGVGSTLGGGRSPAMTRFVLGLRDLRLYQAVQALIGVFRPAPEARSGTLMANVAGERSIAKDSELYRAGVRQFTDNLDALLKRYAAAGIRVFIGTLASNEKDQPPFLGMPPDRAGEWRETIDALVVSDDTGTDTLAEARGLVDLYPDWASPHYYLGRAKLRSGDTSAARQAFYQAIDLDRLRFRAPQEFRDIIHDAAQRHRATVVDTHAHLAAASEHGLIGYRLMLEHLHPNAEGYYLMGEAFYDALRADGLGLEWRSNISPAVFREQQPLTRIEILHGSYRVGQLMKDWPFVETREEYVLPDPADREEEIAQAWYRGELDWLGAMNEGLKFYQRNYDFKEASKIAINLADAFPFEAQPQHLAGMMLVQQANPQGRRAIPYFHRAVTLKPDNVLYLTTLARAYTINGFPDAARTAAERLLRLSPGNEMAVQILEHLDKGQ